MTFFLGLEPLLKLAPDGCRRVLRSEWRDVEAFPLGYEMGILATSEATVWGATEDGPAAVFHAWIDVEASQGGVAFDETGPQIGHDYALSIVRLLITLTSDDDAPRKLSSVAEPFNSAMGAIGRLPWLVPRFVLLYMQSSPSSEHDGRQVEFLFDAFDEAFTDLDPLDFLDRCWSARVEFLDNFGGYFDEKNHYTGPTVSPSWMKDYKPKGL